MARILTFNCHEGYVSLLSHLGLGLDVVDGLPGRYVSHWDERMRPVPANTRLIALEAARGDYDAIIAHNVRDLLDVRHLDAPKILVLHVNLRARLEEEPGAPGAAAMREQLARYLDLIRGTLVAVSEAKGRSWGLPFELVPLAVDEAHFHGHRGEQAALLRVANQIGARRRRLGADALFRATEGLPLRVVGHNPDLPGAAPSTDWHELLDLYRSHRAYVHTGAEGLEDGHNLSVLEAMCTGLPVLTTVSGETPVIDGENGYFDADPAGLRARARSLLEDPALASRLGARARETVLERYSLRAFLEGWHRTLERARRRWGTFREHGDPVADAG